MALLDLSDRVEFAEEQLHDLQPYGFKLGVHTLHEYDLATSREVSRQQKYAYEVTIPDSGITIFEDCLDTAAEAIQRAHDFVFGA